MFSYQLNEMQMKLHPNAKSSDLLDGKLLLIKALMQLSQYSFDCALRIANKEILQILMEISKTSLNHCELLNEMIKQLQGIDVRYLDGSYDELLCYETIDDDHIPLFGIQDDHNDLRIALSSLKSLLSDLLKRIAIAYSDIDDDCIRYLKLIEMDVLSFYKAISKLYEYYETHLEQHAFDEVLATLQFDLTSGNYFDKLTPYYIK